MTTVISLTNNGNPSDNTPCLNVDSLAIGEAFARERDLDALLRRALDVAMTSLDVDGGVMFRVKDGDKLHFINARTRSLGMDMFQECCEDLDIPGIPLHDAASGQANHFHIAVHVALSGEAVEVNDIYEADGFDFAGTKKSDASHSYRTRALRVVPIKDSDGGVVAVLQLSNPKPEENSLNHGFNEAQRTALRHLLSFVEVNVQNRLMELDQRNFVESVIQVLAQAIDAKSPHTGNHCQKVPIINELLAEVACAQTQGPFADYDLNEDEKYELRVAAWLHDCGKIAVPEHIMAKSSRLEGVRDGVNEIATRIEIIKRDIRLAAQQRMMDNPQNREDILAGLTEKLTVMNRNLTYIMSLNYAETINDPIAEQRIRAIASIKWNDWNGFELPLLSATEVDALLVKVGTLTEPEREIIERHASYGIEMLDRLSFPKNLRRVRDIAGAHHERMDGSGYPNQLRGDQVPLAARMLAIADIFEALTASDRPYKRQKTLNQAIAIMSNMRDAGHIDAEVFELFLESKVWLEYAVQHMPMKAIDRVPLENYRRQNPDVAVGQSERLAAE